MNYHAIETPIIRSSVRGSLARKIGADPYVRGYGGLTLMKPAARFNSHGTAA